MTTAAPSADPASAKSSAPVKVAVVGAGYWGVNHVRSFARLPGCELVLVCDPDPKNRARAAGLCPTARLCETYEEVLADPGIDAVVLATPAVLHASQALAALTAGKHVLVEKPMALTTADAELLVQRAESAGRTFMVGHLMLYHAAVLRLREMIQAGDIGEVYYLYALRVNLGRVRQDENAMWSLAPHDISIILYLLNQVPVTVAARGQSYLQPGVEDVVFMNLGFADGKMAQIQLSWLDPRKERRLTVVGERRMVELDDAHPTEKLRIYDKGFARPPRVHPVRRVPHRPPGRHPHPPPRPPRAAAGRVPPLHHLHPHRPDPTQRCPRGPASHPRPRRRPALPGKTRRPRPRRVTILALPDSALLTIIVLRKWLICARARRDEHRSGAASWPQGIDDHRSAGATTPSCRSAVFVLRVTPAAA